MALSNNDEYGWKKTLSPGIRFQPTDEEIINYYLKCKSHKQEICPGIINDLDIYLYEPQELEALAFNHGDGRMYFFAPFKRMNGKGSKGKRRIADDKGYWKASQARASVKDSKNRVIGTKRALVYYICGKPKDIKTSWLMSEYRLSQADFEDVPIYNNEADYELALCVVYHHEKKGNKDQAEAMGIDMDSLWSENGDAAINYEELYSLLNNDDGNCDTSQLDFVACDSEASASCPFSVHNQTNAIDERTSTFNSASAYETHVSQFIPPYIPDVGARAGSASFPFPIHNQTNLMDEFTGGTFNSASAHPWHIPQFIPPYISKAGAGARATGRPLGLKLNTFKPI